MGKTKIEWATDSWNPIRAWLKSPLADQADKPPRNTGSYCELITPGCEHCYAEAINKRLGTGLPYRRLYRDDVKIFLDERILMQPLHWKRPRRIFPCSMTDLFGEWMSNEMLDRVFAVMALCPQHTFLPLTKRAERMRDYIEGTPVVPEGYMAGPATEDRVWARSGDLLGERNRSFDWPLPNLWAGVSIEDQRRADERIPFLFQTPAAVRWLSLEPLLEHVEPSLSWGGKRINWVIVGGESGPGARPFGIGWARSIIEQCREAGTACFIKQVGARPYYGVPACGPKLRDRKGGDISEWPVDIRVREYPAQERAWISR
jgi:protein gp37